MAKGRAALDFGGCPFPWCLAVATYWVSGDSYAPHGREENKLMSRDAKKNRRSDGRDKRNVARLERRMLKMDKGNNFLVKLVVRWAKARGYKWNPGTYEVAAAVI